MCFNQSNDTPTAGNTSTVPFTIGSETKEDIEGHQEGDRTTMDLMVKFRMSASKGLAKYKGGFDVPKPYTPVGIESWRTVADCTANNSDFESIGFCCRNFSDGNLTYNSSSDTGNANIRISTGNFYFEASSFYASVLLMVILV